jgi:hypothetical protein
VLRAKRACCQPLCTHEWWGDELIKIVGQVSCDTSDVQADPWIPLTVTWQLERGSGLLNLYVRGTSGGYLEMRVDESTRALVELVVIESPPETVSHCSVPDGLTTLGTVVLDRDIWQWRVTPDYTEPAKRDSSVLQELSWSVQGDTISLLFASSQPTLFVGAGDAQLGISESGELVCMVVRKPDVELPAGYPA